jgi:undecaprenyl-diphosphatase
VAVPEAIQAIDEAILRSAVGFPGWAVPIFYALTVIGGGWGLLTILPFLLRRTTRLPALWLLAGVLVTSGLVSLLKPFFDRVRPCDALGWCTPVAVASPGGHSFPSGHAAGSFAFAAFLAVRAPKVRAPALVCAGLIAWSRCVLGVHYPSDVLVGAALGSIIGAAFAVRSMAMEKKLSKKPSESAAQDPPSQKSSEREGAAEADPM